MANRTTLTEEDARPAVTKQLDTTHPHASLFRNAALLFTRMQVVQAAWEQKLMYLTRGGRFLREKRHLFICFAVGLAK